MTSDSLTWLQSLPIHWTIVFPLALSISALISSMPDDLLLFIVLMVFSDYHFSEPLSVDEEYIQGILNLH